MQIYFSGGSRMKKLSIFCTFMFVSGLIASSAFAQCISNDECDDGVYCTDNICEDGNCVYFPNDSICDDEVDCNGGEICDSEEDCLPGDSQCEEPQVCNIDIDECVFVGSVDIKPGSCQSPLNVRSLGVLPVAILGTGDFLVESINPTTIMIPREGLEPIKPIRYSYEDVGAPPEGDPCVCENLDGDELDEESEGDGFMDLTLKFSVLELVEGLGLKDFESREIIPIRIMWEAEDGTPTMGEDCVKIINNFKWWDDLLEQIKKPKKPKKPKNGDEE
jgi:hypothetical protein